MKIWKKEDGLNDVGFLIDESEKDSGEEVGCAAVAKQLLNRIVEPLGTIVHVPSIELSSTVKEVLEKVTSAGNVRSKYPPMVIGSLSVIEKVYEVTAAT